MATHAMAREANEARHFEGQTLALPNGCAKHRQSEC